MSESFRYSDEFVRHAFYLLMTRLEKGHAEIRLSAFQIARELFVRSHCFRDLLLSDFQRFLELVLGKFFLHFIVTYVAVNLFITHVLADNTYSV